MSSKKRVVGTMTKGLLLTAALLLAQADTVLADDASKFVPGTRVNGVLVGGMTVEEAKVQIEGFYGREYSLTLQEKGQKSEVISGPEIGYQAVLADGLKKVLDEENASGRVSGPNENHSYTVSGTAAYDEEKLAAKLKTLDCVRGQSVVKTADAAISSWQEGVPFTIVPEVYGNSVNEEKLKETVTAALNAGLREVNLEASGCYDTVAVTSENPELKAGCEAMNRMREMTVTYAFGANTEALGGEEICQWVTGLTAGVPQISQEKAAAYVKTLADKYDTAGRQRTIHTPDGREAAVVGAYGWQIDQAAETAALIAAVQTGQSQTREPVYSQTAADRNNDWGGTYVEVDLETQHVYMYQDGALIWDSPCVTGNVSKNCTTPDGIYTLAYKQTDRVLRGKKLADGTYEYESHVDYWMPFNGGIGFHDASWRSKFGGTIYQSGGSHGCVNLPVEKAKALYGLVYQGIPVICHH